MLIVDAGRAPGPAGSGCERAQISGLYWVRPVNTLVVDVGGVTPKLLLIKGHYTPPRPTPEGGEAHTWRLAPTGMVVYGAPGMASLRDAVTVSCGTVTSCSGKGTRISAAAGATYWITRYLGADVSYIKPAKVTASGSGTGYRFNSALEVTLQALGWRSEGRYLPLQCDIASTAFWYQTLPTAPFPPLGDRDALEVI